MKATKLISELTELVNKVGDLEVDLNNSHGVYSKIIGTRFVSWADRERNQHKVIEIMHDIASYNTDDSIITEK